MRSFRVWYKIEKRWLKPGEFKINSDGSVATYGVYCHKNDLIRSDSTGLYDRNRLQIYEGDIIRSCVGELAEVIYLCGKNICGFTVKVIPQEGYSRYGWIRNDGEWGNVEVIGNVYENPELLKESEG